MTDVSMIIIAFNEEAAIADTIASIRAMGSFPADHEIIVVDDGSTDRTAEVVAEVAAGDSRVRCLIQPNRGRGAARAAGLAAASGDLIGFVDADIILPEDWWMRCTGALAAWDACGGTAVPDGDVSFVHRVLGLVPKIRPHTTTVSGGNGLFRASVFDRVCIDPAKRNGEDVALNHAMDAAGIRTVTVPGLLVEHRESKSFATSCRWLFESGIGATRQLREHRQVRMPDVVAVGFLSTLVLACAGLGNPWLAAAPAAYVMAASGAHLASKFDLLATPARSVVGVALHAPLMGCYLAGRLAGIAVGGGSRG